MTPPRMAFRIVFASCLALMLTACDSDPAEPDITVEGSWTADSFVADGVDVLAAGGSLFLILDDGQVSGSLSIPEAAGGPLSANMAGTYEVDGAVVRFTQAADTFVRDAVWTWSGDVMEGVFGAGAVTVRLVR